MTKKIWLIIKREYWTRVRSRTFLVATFLTPVGMLLLFTMPILLEGLQEEEKVIAIVDEANLLEGVIKDVQSDDGSFNVYFKFEKMDFSLLEETFPAMGYDGILRIPRMDLDNPIALSYVGRDRLGMRTRFYIEGKIAEAIKDKKIERAGLNRDILDRLKVDRIRINDSVRGEDAKEETHVAVAAMAGGAMGFTIYMVLFIYGTMLMRGVLEEKKNRIMEVLLSTIKPFEMMLGKIVGIGAVCLTQFMIWILTVVILQFILALIIGVSFTSPGDLSGLGGSGELNQEQMELVQSMMNSIHEINFLELGAWFIFYFLGGYLMYGALFAAIGAATNDDGDNSQSMMWIVTTPVILSVFIMFNTLQEPDSSLSFWASILPFSSPIVMPARIAYGVDLWEIILSAVLLIAGCLFTTWLAAKIYRTGILMYGKKVNLKEIGKWIFYR